MMSIDTLNKWADAYIFFQTRDKKPPDSSSDWWPVWKFYDLNEENPELCWKVILLILEKTDDERVLRILAAGPLEDLIDSHGELFIDRIEEKVRNSPKFKKVLSKVWESSTPVVWKRIKNILENE